MVRYTHVTLVSLLATIQESVADDDQTDVVQRLNAMIARGDNGVYSGGQGVLVRNPMDDYEYKTEYKVVPATFWTNDIFAPSQLFPSTSGSQDGWGTTQYNPDCPNDGGNGYFTTVGCEEDPGNPGEWGPWNYAGVAYVIGSAMNILFADFDNIQSDDWGWGVFYPTDSNSVDWRCRYIEDFQGYDCGPSPDNQRGGGWIDQNSGEWTDDGTKMGTGSYGPGNPYAGGGGGGTGCHLNKRWDAGQDALVLDQTDAYDTNGVNLVQDRDCQCNYDFSGDWNDWVRHWIEYAVPKQEVSSGNWFQGGLAPSRALDMVGCWTNNVRDMIQIQNALYWARADWSNQRTPQTYWSKDPQSTRIYWGWNEIPMDRESLIDPANHDATMIKLPASVCGNGGGDDTLWCLTDGAANALERDLDKWANGGFLVPGVDHIAEQPGSYIVFLREYVDDNYNWQKYFFCESCTSPNNRWQIVFQPMDSNNPTGACYIQAGVSTLKTV